MPNFTGLLGSINSQLGQIELAFVPGGAADDDDVFGSFDERPPKAWRLKHCPPERKQAPRPIPLETDDNSLLLDWDWP